MAYSVMIIEDEDSQRFGLAEHIQWARLGYDAPFLASDADEAFAVAKRQKIQVVLADVHLNGITGIEIVRTLKNDNAGLCALMISGHDDFEYVQESMEAGANGYILKPVDISVVESWLAKFASIIRLREKILDGDRLLLQRADENLRQARRFFLWALINEAWISTEQVERTILQLALPDFVKPWRLLGLAIPKSGRVGGLGDDGSLPWIERLVSAFETALSSDCAMSGRSGLISLSVGANEALLLQAGGDIGTEESLREKLRIVAEGLAGEIPAHVVYSVPLSGWSEIKIAYRNIHHGLRTLENADESLILCYTELSGKPELDLSALELQGEKLLSAVRYETLKDVEQTLVTLKETIVGNPDISFATKQAYALNIASAVLQITDKHTQDSTAENVPLFTRLLSASDPRVLYEVLSSSVLDCVAAFQAQHQKKRHQAIESTMALIDRHFAEELSLADLAEAVQLNQSYLSVLFKNDTGQTYSEYLLAVRIDKAKELLAKTNQKIYEISGQVGFKNIAYFISVFKKNTGMTPGEFRKSSE